MEPHIDASWEAERLQLKIQTREIQTKYKMNLFHHDSQAMEKVTQRGCAISIFTDLQDLIG